MTALRQYLAALNEKQGSDLHIKCGAPAMLRVAGKLLPAGGHGAAALRRDEVTAMLRELLDGPQWERFQGQKDFDVAVQIETLGRFRVSIFYQRGEPGAVLRRVKTQIPSAEELLLPPIVKKIALSPSGLIIVSGPTGCGKSSSLAAMIDAINASRQAHILSIEDPIEYLHSDKMGLVNQREIGIDTADFSSALRYCMRQDPDVIMIGEMRDEASMIAAMQAAETGHLVLTTLHTVDAAGIIPRVLDLFPRQYQDQIRVQLAGVFSAGICQRLVPCSGGKVPVAPAVEVLAGTPLVKKLIRENKLDKLYAAIETGGEFGMRTLNQSLLEMVHQGLISPEHAMAHSLHPESLKLNLQGIFLDESKRILQTD